MSDYLPPEVLIKILTKLPVKSLLRFTSVCKSWYSLITSPNFITTHLNQTNSNNENQILVRHCIKVRKLPWKEHFSVHRDDESFDKLATLDFPFTLKCGYFRIIGSCNGLVCLADDDLNYKYKMILWNPSIRKFVRIPRPSVTVDSHGHYHRYAIGFGFNPTTNDYKIVRIVYPCSVGMVITPLVELYELSTGSWRSIDVGDFHYLIGVGAPQAVLNGVVHWVGCEIGGFPSLIVSFDLKNEEFGAITVPPSLLWGFDLSVAVFGDSLSLIQHVVSSNDNFCCIWVMKEYGAAKSWSKQFTIDLKNRDLRGPFGFRDTGDVLLSANHSRYGYTVGDLVSYDPKSKQIENLGIHGYTEGFYKDTYVESLVLVKGLSEVLGRQENSSDSVAFEGATFLPNEDDEGQGNKRNENIMEEESQEHAGVVARLDNQIEEAKC